MLYMWHWRIQCNVLVVIKYDMFVDIVNWKLRSGQRLFHSDKGVLCKVELYSRPNDELGCYYKQLVPKSKYDLERALVNKKSQFSKYTLPTAEKNLKVHVLHQDVRCNTRTYLQVKGWVLFRTSMARCLDVVYETCHGKVDGRYKTVKDIYGKIFWCDALTIT